MDGQGDRFVGDPYPRLLILVDYTVCADTRGQFSALPSVFGNSVTLVTGQLTNLWWLVLLGPHGLQVLHMFFWGPLPVTEQITTAGSLNLVQRDEPSRSTSLRNCKL